MKIFNFFIKTISYLTIIFALIIIGPCLFRFKPYVVLSGSMEPSIHTGSVAYVNTNIKGDDIKVGDIIAFNINGMNVTHRVASINENERTIITKGDANKSADYEPISIDGVFGKTEFAIPYVGYIVQMTHSRMFIIYILFLIGGNLICMFDSKDDVIALDTDSNTNSYDNELTVEEIEFLDDREV